jgi:hypothetical protein
VEVEGGVFYIHSKTLRNNILVSATPWWDGQQCLPLQVTDYKGGVLSAFEIDFPHWNTKKVDFTEVYVKAINDFVIPFLISSYYKNL